jgi:hypothetical protein
VRSILIILVILLQSYGASAKWTVIEDRKVSSFDMLTTRLGLIATNDQARVLGKWDNGIFSGVFIPPNEVTSIVIKDKDEAYASIKGNGIYRSSNGWGSWQKIHDAVDSRVVCVSGNQVFITKGNTAYYQSVGSFQPSQGIPSEDSVRDIAIISSKTSYALTRTTLWRSDNGGANYSMVIDTVREGQSLYFDTAAKILFIGAKLPLRTLDGGQSFQTITSIFFFSTSGAIFGTKDCSGAFYIGPDSMEHIEMYRSTSNGRYLQEVGSANFSSYRYKKCVVLDRGSTFFWLDRSGSLSVSRDGCDGTIPDSVYNYVLFRSDTAVINSICSGSSPTPFNLHVRYDLCTGVQLDSLVEVVPNNTFSFSFAPKVVSDSEIAIGGTFRAKYVGIDSVRLRLAFHSHLTGLRESKEIVLYALGTSEDAVLHLPEEAINYGSVKIDQLKKDTLYIVNTGCDTLRIDSLQSSFPALFRLDSKTYPIKILPQKNASFGIEFTPRSEGDFLESVAIWSSLGRKYVSLTGTGYKDHIVSVNEDEQMHFSLHPNPARDIIQAYIPAPTWYVVRDILGNVVTQGTLEAGDNKIETASLPQGTYLFITSQKRAKVIIQR